MKFLSLAITAICFLTSCEPVMYVQLFKTKPTTPLKSQDGAFVYENDTVKITYDFWSEHGKLSFTVYNKLNVPIYIDWRKSSYITGEDKVDYWRDVETIDAATISTGRGYSENKNVFNPTVSVPENGGVVTYGTVTNVGNSVSGSASVSKAVKTKQERITFLAPKTSISKTPFILFPANGVSLKKDKTKFATVPISYDTTKTTLICYRDYDADESLLSFRNFLTLSTTENFSTEFYADNGFYISNISVIESTHFDGSWNSSKNYNYSISKNFYLNLDLEASNYYQKNVLDNANKVKMADAMKAIKAK